MKLLDGDHNPVRRLRPVRTQHHPLLEARVPDRRPARSRLGRLVALAAAALAAGVVTGKVLDWRGHAHPRI